MLKVTTEPLDNCEVMMTVEVDEQRTKKLFKAAAQRISKSVKIPGFRPGKAPYQIIVQRFGEDAIRGEVLEDLSRSVFKQALEQVELQPFAPASMEDVSWEPLVMKVRVPVEPVVELGDYRARRMDVPVVEVTQDEIDQALENLREEYAVWNPVERPARAGDLVTMAIKEQSGDEVLFEDDNFEYEMSERGEDEPAPDYTPHLMGVSAGEEKEFEVTYPDDFAESEYAGEQVAVSVTMHSVKEKELYPLDDDFAQTVGDFDTLDQLIENLTDDLKQKKQRQADGELAEKALDELIEKVERVEWPLAFEEEEIDRALEDQNRQLQRTGMDLDTYLSVQKKTRDELREELRPAIQQRLRRSLIMNKLIELENLSIAGHEISDQVDRLSLMAGERSDEMRQVLTAPHNLQHIAGDLLTAKVMERLVQLVKGEVPEEVAKEVEQEVKAETEETGK